MKNGYTNYTIPEGLLVDPPPASPLKVPGSFARINEIYQLGKPVLVSLPSDSIMWATPTYCTLSLHSTDNEGPSSYILMVPSITNNILFRNDDTVQTI